MTSKIASSIYTKHLALRHIKRANDAMYFTSEATLSKLQDPAPGGPGTPVFSWDDGVANAGRISSGILGTLAGGLGGILTGAAAGANNTWNAVVPTSMQTSPEYTRAVNNTFQKTVDFTNSSAADVWGGLGGPSASPDNPYAHPAFKRPGLATDYHNSQSRQMLEAGYNDPTVAPWARNTAYFADRVGSESWNLAQQVMGAKMIGGGLSRVPGAQATANAVARATPAPVRAAITYGAGIPVSKNVNPVALLASLTAQRQAANLAAIEDAWNARTDTPTNYSQYANWLPANATQKALTDAVGPDVASAANGLMFAGAGLPASYYVLPTVAQATMDTVAYGPGNQPLNPPPPTPQPGDRLLSTFANNEAAFNARFNELPPEQANRVATLFELKPDDPGYDTRLAEIEQIMLPPPAEVGLEDDGSRDIAQVSWGEPEPPNSGATVADQPAVAADNNTDTAQVSWGEPESAKSEPETANPVDDQAISLGLPSGTAPEIVEQAAQIQTSIGSDPRAQAAISNIDGDDAKQIIEEGQPIHAERAAADYTQTTPPPKNPQDWAEWFRGMTEHITTTWNSMDPYSKLAIGLGVPLGIVGLLSGNMGGFLMGAIGLGVGGLAAAQGGMFSPISQNTAGQTATDSKNQLANGTKNTTSPGQPPLSVDDQVKLVQGLGSVAKGKGVDYITENRPKFDQLVSLTDDQLTSVAQKIPESSREIIAAELQQINQQITTGMQELEAARNGLAGSIPGLVEMGAAAKLPDGVTIEDLPKLKTQVERMLDILNNAPPAPPPLDSGAYMQNNLMPKIARCWKGYEPVPGKKPYADGSCRPVSGKKTQKKMKKKSADYLSFISADKPAILTLIRGYYGQPTRSQSVKVSAQRTTQTIAQRAS